MSQISLWSEMYFHRFFCLWSFCELKYKIVNILLMPSYKCDASSPFSVMWTDKYKRLEFHIENWICFSWLGKWSKVSRDKKCRFSISPLMKIYTRNLNPKAIWNCFLNYKATWNESKFIAEFNLVALILTFTNSKFIKIIAFIKTVTSSREDEFSLPSNWNLSFLVLRTPSTRLKKLT